MDEMRDLARDDPWRASLERSLVRRRRASGPLGRASTRPPPAGSTEGLPPYWRLCWRAAVRRWPTLVAGAAGLAAILLLAAARPGVSDGENARAAEPAPGRLVARATPAPAPPPAAPARACQPQDNPSGYVNPLGHAVVTARRIDQGVDYAGSGVLTALGNATVTLIATSDTGWPGAFIEYRLANGPEAGCYVFYAEGITPADGLYVGEAVSAGQPIATLIPNYSSGIEIGWGADKGTETYAAEMGQWSAAAEEENIPTPAGLSFSALITSLGAPPGRVKG